MGVGDEVGLKTVKEIEKSLPVILGAENVNLLLVRFEEKLIRDIDGLIDNRVKQIHTEATELIDHGVSTTRAQLATLIKDDIELAVDHTRKAAEILVNRSLDRVTEEARALVKELSTSISEQREHVVVDLGQTAVVVRKELLKVLPWVAVVAGLMNLAGIVVAWLFASSAQ